MSMLKRVQENFALVVGISLPLLLVLVFWIATAIPKMTVPDPRYDMIYTADFYDYNALVHGAVRVDIQDGKLRATFHSSDKQNYRNTPRIYYFDVSSGSIHELSIDIPADPQDGQLLSVPEAETYTLSNKSIAPDGYSFDGNYSSRSGFFFFDGGYRYRGIIKKDGRAIKIPTHGHQYQGNLRFLAWVMDDDQP
ncbi:MAG: hypothetical protein ABJ308_06595 [Halieaceae bacterium]